MPEPRTSPPSPAYVTTADGCRIAVWLDGPPTAPVLLLANSLGTTAAMWSPQLTALAARFRLLRYDSRGHGASGVPPGDYTIERLGRDALEVADAHGVERFHFCGLSKGGMVGQWVAAHAPARVDRLVLANTAAYMGPPAAWQGRIDQVRREGMGSITEEIVTRWFTPGFRATAPAAVDAIRAMLLATDPVGYTGCCAALRDLDLRASAARITAPTLLICGSEDPATPPPMTAEIAAGLPAPARIITLPTAHLSSVEQPGAFTAAVLEHLA